MLVRRFVALAVLLVFLGAAAWAAVAGISSVKDKVAPPPPPPAAPPPPKPIKVIFPEGFTRREMGERGDAVYFNNPADYVAHLQGDHLDWLRTSVSILVICGQGQWEDTTGALEGSKHFVASLAEKGLRHELDLWGHDVPHDWPSWRAQLAHHLPRFC